MSEKTTAKPGNGLSKENVITSTTPGEKGVIDEVELVIERGEARVVPLENIEKGLTTLWQAAAKQKDGETGRAVTRACVGNLIIVVDTDEELARATDTIAELTWGFPCRAIVLVGKPEMEKSDITASISAHCQAPSSGRKVCCEQITIVATGEAADGLWSMVLPLLVPDLPVILWWPGEPILHGNLFERLLETCDRLIVDSRAFENPLVSFSRLAELSSMQYANTSFSDLSWTRLTQWRALIAQFFDNPAYLPYLFHVDRVEIQYEAPDDNNHPNFSEALLLVGWLAHQLGWQPAFALQRRGNNATVILNQKGLPLTVVLHGHNERKDELGGITQVQIIASRDGDTLGETIVASFTVTLSEDYNQATILIDEDESPLVSRNVLFTHKSSIELLREDLEIVSRDTVFEAALELAGQFSQL